MESRTVFERRDKVNYYLDLAEVVGERATCIRRHFGAVIVKDDEVISTGYVGAPRGRANCNELGYCVRENLKV
ncbi:MAG TPA: cytidine deaminase, partial [Bacillota bacterium]|nr:cytidine deaminase [Bacillota bacterium]